MDLAELFRQLEEQYGPTAEYMFQLGVRNQIIGGIGWLVFSALMIAFSIVLYIGAIRAHRRGGYDSDETRFIGSLVGSILLVLAIFTTFHAITKLLNPEYMALIELLGAF